ncbi:MAG: putative baseplate assembly protein [Desulfobacterales bacterium]|nr:MAG: putative baseplate assembly protein [Desulfobacterales bacterium]
MSAQPLIDTRRGPEIVARADQLAKVYTPDWTPREGNPAQALIHLFGRLMEIVIDRLNRVPEKHFLAFLDAAGVTPLPPRAARAPVRFVLAAGATGDGFVPKATPLASAIKDQPPVTFETEKDLIVIRAQLAGVFAYTPQADKYRTGSALLQANAQNIKQAFAPFDGDTLVPHRIYIAHDTMFAVSAATRIEIAFTIPIDSPPSDADFFTQKLKWFCRAGGQDQQLTAVPGATSETVVTVVLPDVALIEAWKVKDTSALWIWAQTGEPLTAQEAALTIQAVACTTQASDLPADLLFHNAVALDGTREFYPFGERPKRYDTFFVACREAFSKTGSRITLAPSFAPGVTSAVELQWEFWNGDAWETLGKSAQPAVPVGDNPYNFSDATEAFTASGSDLKIEFVCPAFKEAEVNGKKNLWVRVRLMSGGYGEEAKMELTEKGAEKDPEERTLSDWTYSPASYEPPVITSLAISYVFETSEKPHKLLAENNFMIEALAVDQSFKPFATSPENLPGFYLGLDSLPTPGKRVSLYLSVTEAPMSPEPVVVWEYWDGSGWKRLAVSDATRNLTESGIVKFTVPPDFTAAVRFTDPKPRFWLRVKLEAGDPKAFELDALHLNTVWARNAVTIRNETLGSSTETPDASFKLSRVPVLEGQQVEAREPEPPAAEELTILKQEEGDDVLTAADATGRGSASTWVRWHEVDDFRLSKPRSRHYLIDRATGGITFGDGVHGMVPPAGRDNIRARIYQTGGEARGNVPVNTITVLKRAIPFIDAVCNVEAAGGGSAMESAASLTIRGPRALKHRERAVTWEDYEWLAREASFQVARARCLPAADAARAGKVSLIIVPASEAAEPFPTQGLIRQVRQYIEAAMTPTAELLIDGPKYVRVAITGTVVPEQPEQADFVRGLVEERLRAFFHPLKGGPDEQGWEFGRDVHVSEVCKVIEDTPGVHHAEDVAICGAFYEDGTAVLSVRPSFEDYAQLLEHVAVGADYLVASGEHWIRIPGASLDFPVSAAPFLGNSQTKELHNLKRLQTNCRVPDIREAHVKYFRCLSTALREGYDFCAWCFGRQYSMR